MWYSKIVRRDKIRNPREEINMITFLISMLAAGLGFAIGLHVGANYMLKKVEECCRRIKDELH